MDTSEPEGSSLDAAPAAPEGAALEAEVPSVVAVVVTSGPGTDFGAALASLDAQDYPSLTVLVVDAGSGEGVSARIAEVIPDAYVRRVAEPTTFGAAANDAFAAVEGAAFLLFLHDDVVLEPDALSRLVEEAFRSNAGIVGPKFVEAERPEALLQVGMMADKFGVPFSPVEPGELDHEQHDAVRDVAFVSSAAMLVRADLCAELEGFDPELRVGVEDLDLCWRARLAGARVIVAPDAVARRPGFVVSGRLAGLDYEHARDPDEFRALEPRHRLQVLLRSYSAWSLVRVVPQALVVSAIQAASLTVMGRRGRARAVLGAWWWALRNLGRLRSERRAVQALRVVPDRDIRVLELRGSSYARAFVAGRLDLGRRAASLADTGRDFSEAMSAGLRRPRVMFWLGLALLVAVGSRDLITGGVPAVGSLLPWPGVADSLREFTSGWRFAGFGTSDPAPPGLALIGLLSGALGGSAALARTAVVVGAIPVGAAGAYRLMHPLARSAWARCAAAAMYATVPVPRNAVAAGRLGPLVFYAAAPFVLERLLRAAGLPPFADPRVEGGRARDRRRAVLALGLLMAVVTAVFPPAVLLLLGMAAALLVAMPLIPPRLGAARVVGAAMVGAGLASALLFPWSFALLVPSVDPASVGLGFRPGLEIADVLRLDTGPARAGLALLPLAVAAHPLLVGSGWRLEWAARAWMLALAGFALAWLPGREPLDLPSPPPEAALVLSALGLSIAVGLGAGIVREELQRFALGWRQFVSVTAVGAFVVTLAPFAADAAGGRWGLPSRDWSAALAWLPGERADGDFRVLWVGDPSVLPLDPLELDQRTGYGVTRNGVGDAVDLWPAPPNGATRGTARALRAALAGRTTRLGHLLGPLAVRYVAHPLEPGPTGGEDTEGRPPTAVEAALARQTDLVRLAVDPGVVLYENEAWTPAGTLLTGETAESLLFGAFEDPLRADLSGGRPVHGLSRGEGGPAQIPPPREGEEGVAAALLHAEAYDGSWSAELDGHALRQVRAFRWVNAYSVPAPGPVEVRYGGQSLRWGAVALEAALWLAAVVAWRRRCVLERAGQLP